MVEIGPIITILEIIRSNFGYRVKAVCHNKKLCLMLEMDHKLFATAVSAKGPENSLKC